MSVETPMLEITDAILEVGGETLKQCIQCGTCTGVCPWNLVKEFNPRQLIRLVSLGLEGYEQDSLWDCVTCGTCVSRCPRGIDMIDVIRATRSSMVEMGGGVPPLFRAPFSSLRGEGNPWGAPRGERVDWNKEVGIPDFNGTMHYLFFVCCTNAYDARNKSILRKLSSLLVKGGISMGILGTDESCCGDQAHKCGGLEISMHLEEINSKLFAARNVKRIITTSPHCMNMFLKQYSGNHEVFHYAQIFDELIRDGRLGLKNEVPLAVVYHDPCYLGRHNGIYEEPRNVLKSIPGLRYVEFERNRETGLCCGGGGGGIWSEVNVEHRFGVLRIKEARELGAQVIATACPFCMIMLEDSLKALNLEEEMKILDVAELLYTSVE